MDKLGCQKGDIMNYARSLFIHYCNCKVVTLFSKRNIHNLLQYFRDSLSKTLVHTIKRFLMQIFFGITQLCYHILRQITTFQNTATNWIMECVTDNSKRL